MEVKVLSKEGADVTKVEVNGDIILELSADIVNDKEQLKLNIDYSEKKYTQDEIRNIINIFMKGAMDSLEKVTETEIEIETETVKE